jgi:hypothetical protein
MVGSCSVALREFSYMPPEYLATNPLFSVPPAGV